MVTTSMSMLCPGRECNASFNNTEDLCAHLSFVHCQYCPFECVLCGQQQPTQQRLTEHWVKSHPQKDKENVISINHYNAAKHNQLIMFIMSTNTTQQNVLPAPAFKLEPTIYQQPQTVSESPLLVEAHPALSTSPASAPSNDCSSDMSELRRIFSVTDTVTQPINTSLLQTAEGSLLNVSSISFNASVISGDSTAPTEFDDNLSIKNQSINNHQSINNSTPIITKSQLKPPIAHLSTQTPIHSQNQKGIKRKRSGSSVSRSHTRSQSSSTTKNKIGKISAIESDFTENQLALDKQDFDENFDNSQQNGQIANSNKTDGHQAIHYHQVLSTEGVLWACNDCNKTFACKGNVTSHWLRYHNTNPGRFACKRKGCGATFAYKCLLVKHDDRCPHKSLAKTSKARLSGE